MIELPVQYMESITPVTHGKCDHAQQAWWPPIACCALRNENDACKYMCLGDLFKVRELVQ